MLGYDAIPMGTTPLHPPDDAVPPSSASRSLRGAGSGAVSIIARSAVQPESVRIPLHPGPRPLLPRRNSTPADFSPAFVRSYSQDVRRGARAHGATRRRLAFWFSDAHVPAPPASEPGKYKVLRAIDGFARCGRPLDNSLPVPARGKMRAQSGAAREIGPRACAVCVGAFSRREGICSLSLCFAACGARLYGVCRFFCAA
ncbi:hypothetical protein BV25DRAFT_365017 [Artomyces pyxidatus]|uniref:Uncharacterized protein n=1 Tax=Artomyces pyxidatus TaxID=48021 RepID=A0ACB8T5R1_9AGAM|nr:hypothetical protein BV25DRAFT_365017 [Artomyces pyxidatus]